MQPARAGIAGRANLPTTTHLRALGLRLANQMAVIFGRGPRKSATKRIDGTAMCYVARLDDYFGRFPAPVWLFDQP
jgi:hypothetical protein